MKIKKIHFIYLLPIIITLCVCLHFAIQPKWFHEDWSYAETSFFGLILGLFNSIPFICRVIKTKSTKSFSALTLICNAVVGIIGTIVQTHNGITGICDPPVSLSLELCRWIPDLIVSYIGLLTALYVLAYKMINSYKSKDENFSIRIHNWRTTVLVILVSYFVIIGATIALYYNIKKTSEWDWPTVLSIISGCIAIVASTPFVIKVMITKHVYSISLLSKVSLLCAMVIWTLLDIQTVNIERITNYIPRLVGDGFTITWTIILISYKVKYNKTNEKSN